MNSPLQSLFPSSVIACGGSIQDYQGDLFPEEQACVERAVVKRIREFTAGRTCARIALEQLNVSSSPILPDAKRAPIWPEGIVGSITHTDEKVAVAVAQKSDIQSIGIDMEAIDRVEQKLWKMLFTEKEQSYLSSLSSDTQQLHSTLFFSAKECFFKFQFPLTKQWVEFQQASIAITDENKFTVTLDEAVAHELELDISYTGNFVYFEHVVITGLSRKTSK